MRRIQDFSVSLSLVFAFSSTSAAAQAPVEAPPAEPLVEVRPAERLTPLTGIALRKGRRVVSQLRVAESDMPTVIAATRQRASDGAEDLFIVFEVSLFNQCVVAQQAATAAARPAAREACRDTRGIETKLAHVTVAPTPAGRTEDVGGAVTIVARVSMGIRRARPESGQPEVYFQSMGAVSTVPASTLRVWVAVTNCALEESSDSRGEDIRSTWYAYEEQVVRVYDVNLEINTELVVAELQGSSFDRRADYTGPDAAAPTVRVDPRTHALTVQSGQAAQRVLAYDAAQDTFSEL